MQRDVYDDAMISGEQAARCDSETDDSDDDIEFTEKTLHGAFSDYNKAENQSKLQLGEPAEDNEFREVE